MKKNLLTGFILICLSLLIQAQNSSKNPDASLPDNDNGQAKAENSNMRSASNNAENLSKGKEPNNPIQETEQKAYSNTLTTLSLVLAGVGLMIALFAITVSFWAVYANNKIKSLEEKDRRIDKEISKLKKLEEDYQKGIKNVEATIDSTESKLVDLIDKRTNRQLAVSLVEELISTGQFERAIIKIEIVIEKYCDDEEIQRISLINRGNVLCHENNKKRDVNRALEIFEEYSTRYGANYQVLDYLGYCHLELCKENGDQKTHNHVRSAIECFKKITLETNILPYDLYRARLNIASGYLMIDEFDRALEVYLDLSAHKTLMSDRDFKQVELGICICQNEITDDDKRLLYKEFNNKDRFVAAIEYALENFRDEEALILNLKKSFEEYWAEQSDNGDKPN